MAEGSIASDLKSEELKRFREFESHSLLKCIYIYIGKLKKLNWKIIKNFSLKKKLKM